MFTQVSAIAKADETPADQPTSNTSKAPPTETINDINIDVSASEKATQDFKEDAWLDK